MEKNWLAGGPGERETVYYISFVSFWILYHLYVVIYYKNTLFKRQKEVQFS